MDWRFILSLLFAVVVTILALQNAGPVEVNFFTIKIAVSQALVILISTMFGAVIVMLLSLVRLVKLRSKVKNSTKTIIALEEENRQLIYKLEANTKNQKKVVEQGPNEGT
jgi:lipopolysaccharide assembly protein A